MVLRLLTGTNKKLATELTSDPDAEVVDLAREDVDYRAVLEKVFAADSIQVF